MCPLCDSPAFKEIGRPLVNYKLKSIIKNDYRIVKCLVCSFYYVNPLINFTNNEWDILYDENYFEDQTKWHFNKRKKDRLKRISLLEQYSTSKVQKFLDVGCGEGFILVEAIRKGWEVYGLDIADNRMLTAKIPKIIFTKGNLLSAGYPDNFFDCIYLDSIIEHVTNPKEYLYEVHRILKVGGVVYLGVPNEDSLQNFFKAVRNLLVGKQSVSSKLKPFVSPYHIVGFNEKSLRFILNKKKFKVLKFRNFATRAAFLLSRFPSKAFFQGLGLTTIYLAAFLLRKEYYFEVYATKKDD